MTDLEKAKEWLGGRLFSVDFPMNDWGKQSPMIRGEFIGYAWDTLVIIHGEESAKMVLLSKWSDVKGGRMVSVAFPQPGFTPGSWVKVGDDEFRIRLACGCVEVNYFSRRQSKRELHVVARDASIRRCEQCKGGGK